MVYKIIKKIPPIEDIMASSPLSDTGKARVQSDRIEVQNILSGKDPRLLMIVGPCSAWPNTAVLEYAEKLKTLSEKVKDTLKVIMRVYIQKPRTVKGWTGPLNQPDPFSEADIEAGMRYTHKMMVDVIEMGLPIADEALFTHNAEGFLELLSWVAIGARSAEDQEHRIFASAIDCPVGLKNPTHGVLSVGANSVAAAQAPHVALLNGYEVKTQGNSYAHLVLRGGNGKPNYSLANIEQAQQHMQKHGLENPAIIVDASHDNCLKDGKKDYTLQPQIAVEVMNNLMTRPDLKPLLKGFMMESFIKNGAQKLDKNNPDSADLTGLSITDPCLSFEDTEKAFLEIAEHMRTTWK